MTAAALRQALAYARRGWPVFPCLPGQKIPATKHGYQDATTDAQWAIMDAILGAWRARDADGPLPTYEAGSAGPAEADALLGTGREWRKL